MSDYIGPEEPCGLCGCRATGLAYLGDVRYCHGDGDGDPTCYMVASWGENPRYGPGNPDWEYDRARES